MNTTPKSAPSATTFEAQLDVALIHKHPKNPRHKAVADQELIDSVKSNGLIQPLVVAPHPTRDGDYVLIAGHRRLEACKKNRYKTVPALVRADLVSEAKQIEAMLIENGRRTDLSPIEEAEGYQQLALFPGYTQKRVAQTVGVDPKTVSSRLRLLKLQSSTQKKVHSGQITIDDALAIVEFADDPAVTKRLESAVNDNFNFKYALQAVRREKRQAEELAQRLKDLEARKVTRYEIPAGVYTWDHWRREDTPTPLNQLYQGDLNLEQNHTKKCLAYAVKDGIVTMLCTDVASHNAKLSEQERAKAAEREEAAAALRAEREAAALAQDLRARSAAETVSGRFPGGLEHLVRATLPTLLVIPELSDAAIRVYQELLNIPDSKRWRAWGNTPEQNDNLNQHMSWISHASADVLPRVLAAILAGLAESQIATDFDIDDHSNLTASRAYWTYLHGIGHEFTEADRKLEALTQEPAEDEAEAS